MTYTSTINPAVPGNGSSLASAPIRANFAAAQTDINALAALIGTGGGGSAASTGLTTNASSYAMDGTKLIINATGTATGPVTITTPNPASMLPWVTYTVNDAGFNASVNNITIVPPSGLIQGLSNYVLATSRGSVEFFTDANQVNLFTK